MRMHPVEEKQEIKKSHIAIEQRFSECDEMNDYWSNPCDAIAPFLIIITPTKGVIRIFHFN